MASSCLSEPLTGRQCLSAADVRQAARLQSHLTSPCGRRHGRFAARGRQVVTALKIADSPAAIDLRALLNDALQRRAPPAPAAPAAPQAAPPMPPATAPVPPEAPPPPPLPPKASEAVEEAIRNTSTLDNTSSAAGPAAMQGAEQLPTAASPVEQLPPTLNAAGPQGGSGGDVLGGVVDGASEAGRGAAEALSNSLSSAQDAAAALTEGTGAQAKAALGAAAQAASGLGASASEAASGLKDAASGALDSLNQATSGALDTALSAAKDVADGVGGAAASVQESIAASTSAAGAAVEAASANLPEPVQSALSAVAPPISQAFSQVTQSPALLGATVGAAVGLPAVAWWRGRFGGYAGQLAPEQALRTLQDEDALLVDIRSEDERVRDGVVELRFGALGKGAALPIPAVPGTLARSVRNASELALQIAAVLVSGLGQVAPRTKLLVLDGRGGARAVALARTLRTLGFSRAYVVQGGFKQWAASGLALKEASDYAVSPVEALGERVGLLAGATGASLAKPGIVGASVAVAGLTYFALFEPLAVLRWVGTLGLLLTATTRVLSYNSPQDFLDDVQGAFSSIGSVGSRAKRLVPAGAIGALSSKLGSTAQGLRPSGSSPARSPAGSAGAASAPSAAVGEAAAGSGGDSRTDEAPEGGDEGPAESERGGEVAGKQPAVVENNA